MTPLAASAWAAGAPSGAHALPQAASLGWRQELQKRIDALSWVPAPLEARHGSGIITAAGTRPLAQHAPAMPVSRRSAERAEIAPVRMHTEQGVTGVQVWLGVDVRSPGAAAQAAVLLAGLLARAPSGTHRIAGVVCNGTPVHACPSQSVISTLAQEQPWPSAH